MPPRSPARSQHRLGPTITIVLSLVLGPVPVATAGPMEHARPSIVDPNGAAGPPDRRTGYRLPVGSDAATDGRPPTPAELVASGAVQNLFDPPSVRWGPGHRGVDLTVAPGAVVKAPERGVVTFAGVVVDRPLVVIAHPDGLRSSLEPVSASVAEGDHVDRGATVGHVPIDAATHCAPVSCLHWGVRRMSTYLDPLGLLGAREPVVLLPLGRA